MVYSVLMRNTLTLGGYAVPTDVEGSVCERLVVQRLSGGAEVLAITEAGLCRTDGRPQDADLTFGNTLVATLIRRDAVEGLEEFLFNRTLPDTLEKPLPGTFFPADGAIRVRRNGETFHLQALGRHLHRVGTDGIVRHAQEPFDETSSGRSWLFDAVRIAWRDEVLPKDP